MLKSKKGAPRVLQFQVDWSQYFEDRLNPDIPIEESYDCGANSLLLLGIISDQTAVDLSAAQTMCYHTGRGEETKFNEIFYDSQLGLAAEGLKEGLSLEKMWRII
jgi:hypothetical protein